MPDRPVLMPTSIGVPTAPKETGVDWMISVTSTAAMAGKPIATNRGAATAAGVPKPEAPSIIEPNSQAMMIAWMRRSGERSVKPRRMARMAPLSCTVCRTRMAPKMMKSSVSAVTRPLTVAPATVPRSWPQTVSAMIAVAA